MEPTDQPKTNVHIKLCSRRQIKSDLTDRVTKWAKNTTRVFLLTLTKPWIAHQSHNSNKQPQRIQKAVTPTHKARGKCQVCNVDTTLHYYIEATFQWGKKN